MDIVIAKLLKRNSVLYTPSTPKPQYPWGFLAGLGPRKEFRLKSVAWKISSLPITRQKPPRLRKIRLIEHLALEPDDTRVRLGLESGDDRTRLGNRFMRRRENLVDDLDLRRVDRQFAGKPVALGDFAFEPQSRQIAKLPMHGVDCQRSRRRRREEGQASRQKIRKTVAAAGASIRFGAETGGEIVRSPGKAFKALARAGISAHVENRRRRLRDDRH